MLKLKPILQEKNYQETEEEQRGPLFRVRSISNPQRKSIERLILRMSKSKPVLQPQHRVMEIGKLQAATDQLYQRLKQENQFRDMFKNTFQRKYTYSLVLHLQSLLNSREYQGGEQIAAIHANKVISNGMYCDFKMIFFQVLCRDKKLRQSGLFLLASRFERVRPFVVNHHELLDQDSLEDLVRSVVQIFDHRLKTVNQPFLRCILEFAISGCSFDRLTSFLVKHKGQMVLFQGQSICLAAKQFLVRRCHSLQIGGSCLAFLLQNLRRVKFLLKTHDLNSRGRRIPKLEAELSLNVAKIVLEQLGQTDDNQKHVVQLIAGHLLNCQPYFHNCELAFLVNSTKVPATFLDNVLILILSRCKVMGLPESLLGLLVFESKQLRRTLLQRSPSEQRIASISKLFAKGLSQRSRTCSALSLAYSVEKDDLYDYSEIDQIHKGLSIDKSEYNKFKEGALSNTSADREAGMLKAFFSRFEAYVVART